jgi:hypothetical protein
MKCLTCKHCEINFGSPGYSEATPGEPGSWECLKRRWNMGDWDNKVSLREAFELGETCTLWESDAPQA